MEHLPPVIVYGQLIWMAVLVLFLSVTLHSVALLRRRGHLRFLGAGWIWVVETLLGGTFLCLALLFLTGEILLRSIGPPATCFPTSWQRDQAGVEIPALRAAAAMPFHRGRALQYMGSTLNYAFPEDEEEVHLGAALSRLAHGCDFEILSYGNAGMLEAAAEAADSCSHEDAPFFASKAHCGLGRFEQASLALDGYKRPGSPPVVRSTMWRLTALKSSYAVRVHLLAGRTMEAARAARWHARELDDFAGFADRADILRCVADAIDARAGDRDADARLETMAAKNVECRLLGADLERGKARLALLDGIDRAKADPLAAWLAAEVNPDLGLPRSPLFKRGPHELLSRPQDLTRALVPAIERQLLTDAEERQSDAAGASQLRAELLTRRAYLSLLTGDHQDARESASEALAEIEDEGGLRGNVAALQILIEMDAGETANACRLISSGSARVTTETLGAGSVTDLRAVARCSESTAEPDVDDIRWQLRGYRFSPSAWAGRSLLWNLNELGRHRVLAAASRESRRVEALAAVSARFEVALRRRDIAVPIWVLDQHAVAEMANNDHRFIDSLSLATRARGLPLEALAWPAHPWRPYRPVGD